MISGLYEAGDLGINCLCCDVHYLAVATVAGLCYTDFPHVLASCCIVYYLGDIIISGKRTEDLLGVKEIRIPLNGRSKEIRQPLHLL